MASAQPEQSSVLQGELTCPVCLDFYRNPHLLPCGHNFCKICLDRLRGQAERGRFRCPECRDTHRCNAGLQKNFKLANISDDYRRRITAAAATASKPRELLSSAVQSRGPLTVPCDYCPAAAAAAAGPGDAGDAPSTASVSQEDADKQERPAAAAAASKFAVKTCLKCEVSMCQEHVRPHLELPAFREHPLTEPTNDLRKRKCPDHDEMYRYFCMVDKVCVCNACTIEGGHLGHQMKTLSNTMKDLKGKLDRQLSRVERRRGVTERKLQEQKEKERQNKKSMDDFELGLARLGEEMNAKVRRFVSRLWECARAYCDANGPVILKNISRIGQDQARLQEVRHGIESLMQENDPFCFIEAYKTTEKQCRRQLRKNMFYPEYVDMETELLGQTMETEMREFLHDELQSHIVAAITALCHLSDVGEEEREENEEEAVEEEEEEDDDDDSSLEEIRSEGEEEEEEVEEEEEEEDDDDEHDGSELMTDDLYSPGEEEDDEDEDEEDGEQEE